MSDWDTPVLATAYATFLANLKARDVNALTLADSRLAAMSNIPTRAKRWNNTDKVFEDWNSSSWDDLILAVTGGGTGSATASGARTNLGLGTIAVQEASSVAITGGTIVDVSLTATIDDQEVIGSNIYKFSKLYLKTGLLIPVGTDKWLTS